MKISTIFQITVHEIYELPDINVVYFIFIFSIVKELRYTSRIDDVNPSDVKILNF